MAASGTAVSGPCNSSDPRDSKFFYSYSSCQRCVDRGFYWQSVYRWPSWFCTYNPNNGLFDLHYYGRP